MSINQSLADIRTPLLHQQWYVAAKVEEITRELLSRYILDRNIVFYRREDGSPVALQNRCAHRSFPLSESKLDGDNIICGYHGIQYDSDGLIVDIPCQETCPADLRIRKYPLVESGPLVWIWMGDADKADASRIPDVSFLDSEEWAFASGQYHVEGNYLLMHENLCDLSHFPFLHGATFSFTRNFSESPVIVEKKNGRVNFYRHGKIADAKFLFPDNYKMEERDVKTVSGGTYISPALNLGWRETTLLDAKEGEQSSLKSFVPHFLTPETQNSCHYYWFFARNYALENDLFGENFQKVITRGFSEDMYAVREMQLMVEKDKHDFAEIHVAGDQPGNMMRRLIKELADNEAEC